MAMRQPRRRRSHQSRQLYGSKMINSRGGSREWTRTVARFIRLPGNQICWLRFPLCTIRSETIDHYYPMKSHPHLTDNPQNWKPACNYCNRTRKNTPVHLIPKLRARLEAEFAARHRPPKALGFFE